MRKDTGDPRPIPALKVLSDLEKGEVSGRTMVTAPGGTESGDLKLISVVNK